METAIRLLDVALRTVISAVVLFIMTKFMGKKQISQLSIFDYVVGITVGSIAAAMAVDQETEYADALLSLVLYAALSVLISRLSLKSYKARLFLNGAPTVLVQNGTVLRNNLRKAKLNIHDFLEECRVNGYFDISDIAVAVMETGGHISILPKSSKRPLTASDFNLPDIPQGLCANLIVDGKIMPHVLRALHKDESWLFSRLKQQGYLSKDIDAVLLAVLSPDGTLTVYPKYTKETAPDILE